jgi:hypothetical protein
MGFTREFPSENGHRKSARSISACGFNGDEFVRACVLENWNGIQDERTGTRLEYSDYMEEKER